jgi:alpha-tubulin suppressor-like RCC1 family protein
MKKKPRKKTHRSDHQTQSKRQMNLETAHSSDANFSLLVAEDGSLYSLGLLEDPRHMVVLPPNPKDNGKPYQLSVVACGSDHVVALTRDGQVLVWGKNTDRRLGFADTEDRIDPVLLPFFAELEKKVICISAGTNYSAAVTEDGELYLWGMSYYLTLNTIPKEFPIPEKITHVACGFSHVLALTETGDVYAFGKNINAECGLGRTDPDAIAFPTKIPDLKNVTKVLASYHNFAVTQKKDLYTWGWGENGSHGLGHAKNVHTPTLLWKEKEDLVLLAMGGAHSIALLRDNTLLTWGCNEYNQLGFTTEPGRPNYHVEPRVLPFSEKVVAIGCANDHSYVITDTGDLWMWGTNLDDRLGVEEERVVSSPKLITTFKVHVPWDREGEWRTIFRWLWLGREEGAAFSVFPVEVIFHFVGVKFN